MGLSGGSDGKQSACNAGDLGLIPWLARSSGGANSNPLRYSCLNNLHGQRSLVGYSPWGCKESDTAERLSTAHLVVYVWFVVCIRSPSGIEGCSLYIKVLGIKYMFFLEYNKRIRALSLKMHYISYTPIPPRCQSTKMLA